MKKITILWITLIILLLSGLLFIGINVSKRTKPYTSLENTIVENMKIFYGHEENLKKLPSKNKISKISIEELNNFGIKTTLMVNEENSEGYGIVKGKSIGFAYKSFIKCKNYTTPDYEKYLKY